MNVNRRIYFVAIILMGAGLMAPAGGASWLANGGAFAFALMACAGAALCLWSRSSAVDHVAGAVGLVAGAVGTLILLGGPGPFGTQAPGLWLFVAGWTLFLWQRLDVLACSADRGVAALLAPGLFGLALLYLWQVIVTGFAVPQVLLPSPSQVATVLGNRSDILWPDFRQTFLKAVLAGFAIGNAAGFVTAMIADRIPFLKRGVLPLCNLASAMPIVGIAPITVAWFWVDSPSEGGGGAAGSLLPTRAD